MPEALKNLYSRDFFNNFSGVLEEFIDNFNRKEFLSLIFDENWENLELKQRARHTSLVLRKFLSGDFEKDLAIIVDVIDYIQEDEKHKPGIESMFIPDYIEVFGIDYPELSLEAMERITRYFSCEFSIRPFILKYPDLTLGKMLEWSKSPHDQVRRLASEGCRPRLPWAMALPFLKKDPKPVLAILQNLKDDPSEMVRRSVANNLNDISKDNPDTVIELTRKWMGKSESTDRLLKHACRSLLKQAHPGVLSLFGYGSADKLALKAFEVLTPEVKMGDVLLFRFTLKNTSTDILLVRFEYSMYFLRANGKYGKKVFKISERKMAAGEEHRVQKEQSFQTISTRRYYPGRQKVSVVINGKESEQLSFTLLEN
jgi:3-methyladenine DNA glycosylase AlkC